MATWLHSWTYVHVGARKIDDRLSGEFGPNKSIIGEEDESTCGEVPSALQVVTSINEAGLLARAKSGEL